jgi:hypothetical protein
MSGAAFAQNQGIPPNPNALNVGGATGTTNVGDVNISGSFKVNGSPIGGGSGTVSSVGLNDTSTSPLYCTFTNSPITATGTINMVECTQAANLVLAGPTTGSAAKPAFRSLVAADLPTIPSTQISGLGTAATVNTGTSGATIPLLNGANTWSGVQTFSAAQSMSAGLTLTNAANAYTQTSTGLSLTSGTTGFGRNITGTVNDASAVDGIIDFANITCTLCTATSYLVDWQVGGSSVFKVSTTGVATASSAMQAPAVRVTGTGPAVIGIYSPATNQLGFSTNSTAAGLIDAGQHWRIGANTPTISSGACGATTNGTLSAGSSDQSGEVIIASATTTLCTITFGIAYTTAPRAVILQAANLTAAGQIASEYVSAIGATTFVITGTALASTSWYYWVQ